MLNADDLQPNNPLLKDGYNEGFRAPDLGWVGTQHRDADPTSEQFEAGSLLFSNFWIGPLEPAQAFAAQLVRDFQLWLAEVIPQEDGEEFSPAVSVAYWEGADTGLAMVATQSLTPDFMINDVPASFEAFENLSTPMIQVAFDGNDNSPHEAINGIMRAAGEDRETMVKLVVASASEDTRDEIQAFYDEHHAPAGHAPRSKM